jgi:hypothetical protein
MPVDGVRFDVAGTGVYSRPHAAPIRPAPPMLRTFAWAFVGLGIFVAVCGVVPIVAWEARGITTIRNDALLGRRLAPWAWPTVIVGVCTSAFGGLLLAIQPPSAPPPSDRSL